MRGKIHAISISKRKGIPKSNIESANLIYEHGIENDVHAGNWHRQVSLLALESIKKMQEMGLDVRPGDFAENITTEGIDLPSLPVGTHRRFLRQTAARRSWDRPTGVAASPHLPLGAGR